MTPFELLEPGTLREAIGRFPDRVEVEAAIREGFACGMGVEFAEATLEQEERELSEQLAASRYTSEDWTFRR